MLLSLPKYDFNWQRDYDPVQPILVKKGTKLIATWVYDNSDHNKANPNAKIDVTWGEQSWQEMMYFRVNYRWADETVDNMRNDLQAVDGIAHDRRHRRQTPTTRWRSPNRAGPCPGSRASPISDLNKDGALDKKELAAGNADRPPAAAARPATRDIDL
jgi:hypothetical protein